MYFDADALQVYLSPTAWATAVSYVTVPELDADEFLQQCHQAGHLLVLYTHYLQRVRSVGLM